MPLSRRLTAEDWRLLENNPNVWKTEPRLGRIYYTTAFRDRVVDAHNRGLNVAGIFREAGLPPEIIGYKRIERCVARWLHTETTTDNGRPAAGMPAKEPTLRDDLLSLSQRLAAVSRETAAISPRLTRLANPTPDTQPTTEPTPLRLRLIHDALTLTGMITDATQPFATPTPDPDDTNDAIHTLHQAQHQLDRLTALAETITQANEEDQQ